jgi:hypothetical protein
MTFRTLLLPFAMALAAGDAMAISTVVTYQGSLDDAGVPANGLYDFEFQLTTTGGTPVGSAVLRDDEPVIGGVFTVDLDFGSAAFDGGTRRLEIRVRPGSSTGAFVVLSPSTLVTPAPYAQRSTTSQRADDVTDGSIDAIDLATSSVTSSKILDATIVAADIAANAIGTAELANDSVTIAKLAAGYRAAGALNFTLGGNSCADFDVQFNGGILAGDFPLASINPDGPSLPANVSLTALEAPANNFVTLRVCNHGNSSASVTGLLVSILSLR